jgi:hypothetical protein
VENCPRQAGLGVPCGDSTSEISVTTVVVGTRGYSLSVSNRPIFTISPILRGSEPPPVLPAGRLARAWRVVWPAVRRVSVAASGHLVDLTAAVALLIVISHATFTTSDDTLARYSGVLSDLSLALLAAWIFNLLIVELPRRHDRARLYSGLAWMIGLMAQSGLSMMEHLSHAAKESINIDPQVGGIIMTADREATDRICAAIGPNTPYAPIPGAAGCWELIRGHIQKARDYHRRLEPWLSAFDVEVSAAMNAVILSQLGMLCEEHEQIANLTLANLSEEIYEHRKACDELKSVHYSKVQPYVPGWLSSLPRRDRKNFTPEKHNARAIAAAREVIVERDVKEAADRVVQDAP